MKLIDFNDHFPDEQSCRDDWRDMRINTGVTCKKCNTKEQKWNEGRQDFTCAKCGFRTTLRSGTVMEGSKLPFRTWYFAFHLMSTTKKGFSAKEMQRQLGINRYEPVWYMMFKIRRAMGAAESKIKLVGEIEIDEGFFRSATPAASLEGEKLLRGRGSQRCTPVIVYAESQEINKDEAKGKGYKCGKFKMDVVDALDSETINKSLRANTKKKCQVRTDAYKGYLKVTKHAAEHKSETIPAKKAGILLPWVHTAIANAKRFLLGVYHRVDTVYLQLYLDEFCFRLNRRYDIKGLFPSLLQAGAQYRWGS